MLHKEARCNPAPRQELDYNGIVAFDRDWSPGGLSGLRYGVGDTAYFDSKLAAEIVAGSFGHFERVTPENQAAVKAARQRLAQIDRTAGILKVGANV
jgi:hypothetical protein